jgi:DNA-3-methyladenine glycosylase
VKKLPREFYNRPTLEVAHDVIGARLVSNRRGIRTSGVIVEVEAYIGEADPACHAAPGPTRRNEPLYGAPGYAYVYLNYGIHALVNLVTEGVGSPAAILIRALEPREGIDVMRRRRGRPMLGRRPRSTQRTIADHELCRGPGNLTVAMGITLADNRCDLLGDRLFLEESEGEQLQRVWSPRIGINVGTEHPWRVSAKGSQAVSGRR